MMYDFLLKFTVCVILYIFYTMMNCNSNNHIMLFLIKLDLIYVMQLFFEIVLNFESYEKLLKLVQFALY